MMFNDEFINLLNNEPYSMSSEEKEKLLLSGQKWHVERFTKKSKKYRNILRKLWPGTNDVCSLTELPYIPVSVFKQTDLAIDVKGKRGQTLESSGTTGQQKSKIFVCSDTSVRQQRALINSFNSITNGRRVPILFMDSEHSIRSNSNYSARNAGVLGFMRLGSKFEFALNSDLSINEDRVLDFLSKYGNEKFLIFGFTFVVWQALENSQKFDFTNGVLIHSGGWKKLQAKAISDTDFRHYLENKFKLDDVINFYGMVEQLGTLFLQGKDGALFSPNFADFIIRCPKSLQPLPEGERGLIQLFSLLPLSYPGHSVLTEDVGSFKEIPDVNGKTFKALTVHGRLPKSEARGCSDTVS